MATLVLGAMLAGAACTNNGDEGDETIASDASTTQTAVSGAAAPTSSAPTGTASTTTVPDIGCFWSQGVTRSANNTQYPDANATYWYTSYTVPAGATVHLSGDFAHARYQSFNSYASDTALDSASGESGVAVDALADVDITPVAGSTNPFRVGAHRDAKNRRYSIAVRQRGAPAAGVGAREANVLYTLAPSTPAAALAVRQEIIYRVYVPDDGLDQTGGVGLPGLSLTTADGAVVQGDEACDELHVQNAAPVNGSTLLDVDTYRALVNLGDPATHPAHVPLTWLRFFNPRFNVLASFWQGTPMQDQIATLDATQRKGFYGNINIDYGVASVNRAFGTDPNGHNVLVLRGRAPTTPITAGGETVMTAAQLRYWSVCQNESPVTTRVSDCLYDEEIPEGADQAYTIVISLAADRPANATDACGVGWMAWGDGDGVDRPTAGTLILRHMLPSPTFANTWSRVAAAGQEQSVLGEYLPRSEYLSRSEFEQLGCPATK
jgi:hypothetical protein